MRGFDLKSTAISLSICAAIALVVSRFSRLSFVASFLIVLGAIFLNGLVATYEDDLPGGFNNPDGKSTPQYVSRVNRVAYWALLGSALSLAVYSLAFAKDLLVGGISLGVVTAIISWRVLVKRRS